MKKFLSILMAMMLVLGMMGAAFADTLENLTTTHTYDVYQIFAGAQADDDTTGALGVTGWGDGVANPTAFVTALKADDTLKTVFTDTAVNATDPEQQAIQVAAALATAEDDSTVAKAFAVVVSKYLGTAKYTNIGAETTVTMDKGYYLFVDKTTTKLPDTNETYTYKNLSLLQVVTKGNITIKQKNDVPSVNKQVWENQPANNATTGTPIGWNDVADYNVGDEIEFKLTATLPTAYGIYKTYKLVFHDTMSEGLTYVANSAKIYIGEDATGEEITNQVVAQATSANAVAIDGADQNLTVTVVDLKSLTTNTAINASSKITVIYKAKLNQNAKQGLGIGNPNKVYLEYSNNPNLNADGTPSEDTGKTPEDAVIVFTFNLEGIKVDAADNSKKLDGAEFIIKSVATGKWVKTVVNGFATEWTDVETDAYKFVSDTSGIIKLQGLDDGQYIVTETKAPDGYTMPADPHVTVTLTAMTAAVNNWTTGVPSDALNVFTVTSQKASDAAAVQGNVDATTGNAQITITNGKGGTLPETGGIGTTLFYLFGSVMTLSSALILVVRRRAEADVE